MAIQCSAAVFLVPASMPMPAGALVIPASGAFTGVVAPGGASARRVVLAAAGVVALQPQGGGEPTCRRGVVCFQLAGGTPSSGDDEAKIEAAAFKTAMEVFEDSLRPLALVGNVKVLDEVKYSAEGCRQLLDIAISIIPITQEQLKDLLCAGEAFTMLAGECREGYVRATALVAATNGAKHMCTFLSGHIDFLPVEIGTTLYTTVPASVDDLDKENYFKELSMGFFSIYQHLRWQLYRHLGVSY